MPVQLNEMEDQFDHADSQDTNLDEIGKCDHDKPPFLSRIRTGGKRSAPRKQREVEKGEHTAAAKIDSIQLYNSIFARK